MHPIVLNIGIGRSGTTFCANALRQVYGDDILVEHEPLSERQAKLRHLFRCYDQDRRAEARSSPVIENYLAYVATAARQRPVVITGGTVAHLSPLFVNLFGDRLRVIHLHRHPVNVAAAAYVSGRDTSWDAIPPFGVDAGSRKLTPFDPHVQYTEVAEVWSGLGRFGRILYQWLERAAAAEEFSRIFPDVSFISVDAESAVFRSDRFVEVFSAFLERPPNRTLTRDHLPRNPTWRRLREEAPLGDAWREYASLPQLKQFAEGLGYSFEEATLEREIRRYQRPCGIGPLLRHWTCYWQVRRYVAGHMRSIGLLPPSMPQRGGGPPRSTTVALRETLSFAAYRRSEP